MSLRTTTLPNGFRIVTEHMPGVKSATLGIWITAGCRHERAEQNGIAHFLEHMAFKGTERRTPLQIAEEIEDVGGYINAYTSREMTAYYARVLEEDVPLAQDVISDIVLNPIFDEDEIEVERGVILSEIGMNRDTPEDVIFTWLQETAFRDQPMGRGILGTEERVNAFQQSDFRKFVEEHYRPDTMILIAAGAVDHDRIVADAVAQFADLPARPAPSVVPGVFSGGERREVKALEQAHFALAIPAPGSRDSDVYAAQIYAIALGGGMSSRLFQEAREKRGLCYSVFAEQATYLDSGVFMLYAGTTGAQIADFAHVAIDELRRAANDLTEVEVARARMQMKAGMLMGLESASNRCERIARATAIFGRVPSVDETVAKIDAVDLDAAREMAARLLTGTPALSLYGPIESAPAYDALAARLAG